MKKLALLMAVVLAWVCIFSGTVAPKQAASVPSAVTPAENTAVRDARLHHMLQLNRVFGADINDNRALLEEAAVSLMDKAEEGPGGFLFVENEALEGLVYNLYGVAVNAETLYYDGFPAKEGYTMILPRGGVDISHTIVEITEEEGGILRVVSCAEIDPHDGEVFTSPVVTRFAPSKTSAFGWVILSAELL